jgi:SH3-like domain-containing protein
MHTAQSESLKSRIILAAFFLFLAILACGSEDVPKEEVPVEATPTPTATLITPTAEEATSIPDAGTVPLVSAGDNTINLRSGPGTEYDVVGSLSRGDSLEIIGRNADSSWWQVSTPNGPAWIAAFVTEASNIDESIPVIEVPTLAITDSSNSSGSDTESIDTTPTKAIATTAACPNPGVQITSPEPGYQFFSRLVFIEGSANIPDFSHYKIEYSTDPNNDNWTYLFQKDTPVENDVLMELNTSTVPSGPYGVRLTVVDRSGNYPEPCIVWYENLSGFIELPSIPPDGWGCSCERDLYNCPNFETHDQAQACYNFCVSEGRGDVHKIDSDDDGLACEQLP